MLSVGYVSVNCLNQPKSGTHGRNKRKSYRIAFMMFFILVCEYVSAFLKILEFLLPINTILKLANLEQVYLWP